MASNAIIPSAGPLGSDDAVIFPPEILLMIFGFLLNDGKTLTRLATTNKTIRTLVKWFVSNVAIPAHRSKVSVDILTLIDRRFGFAILDPLGVLRFLTNPHVRNNKADGLIKRFNKCPESPLLQAVFALLQSSQCPDIEDIEYRIKTHLSRNRGDYYTDLNRLLRRYFGHVLLSCDGHGHLDDSPRELFIPVEQVVESNDGVFCQDCHTHFLSAKN